NPLHAGLNPPPEGHDTPGVSTPDDGTGMLTAGSLAAERREPGQVRKEAALRGLLRVSGVARPESTNVVAGAHRVSTAGSRSTAIVCPPGAVTVARSCPSGVSATHSRGSSSLRS